MERPTIPLTPGKGADRDSSVCGDKPNGQIAIWAISLVMTEQEGRHFALLNADGSLDIPLIRALGRTTRLTRCGCCNGQLVIAGSFYFLRGNAH